MIALLPLAAITAPAPGQPEWLHEIYETVGILCLVVCLVGRGWASIYVAGRKNQEIVAIGPYSVVRNPLYVFSFIGVIGIGFLSEMATLLGVGVIAFVVYHHLVVKREEAHLAHLHRGSFADYAAVTPRWIPDFSRWRDVAVLDVQPRLIVKHLRDSGLFFMAYVFFEVCELAREIGVLDPLFVLP